jgi:UDP-glucose:(heptosyl)LPS alpha-1,3-glucosyltransferase
MKIALLTQFVDRRLGGAEGYTIDLAQSLALRGHDVTVIAQQGCESVDAEARAAGFKCLYLGARGLNRWLRLKNFIGRLRDATASADYDVVHAMLPVWACDVYHPHAGFAVDSWKNGHEKHPQWFARRWAQRFNRWNPKRRGLAMIETAMMKGRPRVFCLTSGQQEFAREEFGLPAENIPIMLYGIRLESFDPAVAAAARDEVRARWKIRDDEALALLIGNNFLRKGVPEALRAMARVKDLAVRLLVAGRDDAGPYMRKAQSLGIADRVIFAGGVDHPQPLYGAADFVLLPTRRDPCSLVVLEAIAMGLPVITTWQNGASEVVRDGKRGMVVNRGDTRAMAEALRAMADPVRRRAMAREALAMRVELSQECHVDRVEDMYRQIVDARGVPQPAGS